MDTSRADRPGTSLQGAGGNGRDDAAQSLPRSEEADLTDMLSELRVLLPTTQLLSAFLITVPFSAGFSAIVTSDKDVFLALFLLSITSLVLLSAPAVQHRLIRPLISRDRFKQLANRQIVVGSILLAAALILASYLVLATVLGHLIAAVVATFVTTLIAIVWLIAPKVLRSRGQV